MKKIILLIFTILLTTITFAQKKEKVKGSKIVTVEKVEVGAFTEIETEDIGLGKKVRKAKEDRVSYFIIIGDKDIEAGKVTLEHREKGNQGIAGNKCANVIHVGGSLCSILRAH